MCTYKSHYVFFVLFFYVPFWLFSVTLLSLGCDCLGLFVFMTPKTKNFLLPFFCLLCLWSVTKLNPNAELTFILSHLSRQHLLNGQSDMHTDLFPNGPNDFDFDFPGLDLPRNGDLFQVRPCCLGCWRVSKALIFLVLRSQLMKWHLDRIKTVFVISQRLGTDEQM